MKNNDNDDRAIGIDGKPSELRSLVDNSSPLNEILSTHYKYKHPKTPIYIIATFTMQLDDNGNKLESIAEWSLFLDDNNAAAERIPIIEDQICLVSQFDKMVEQWQMIGNYDTIYK